MPFAVMSKANRWSYSRTMFIVFICGAGHVLSSLILGLCGIWLGSHISILAGIDDFREEAAAWFMLIFGLIYMIWGIREAAGNKPHKHFHLISHNQETGHGHAGHNHEAEHGHAGHTHENASSFTDAEDQGAEKGLSRSFWPMFIMLALCPSQALIPVLIYPAAQSGMLAVAVIALVFAVFTIGAMLICTTVVLKGVNALPVKKLERYAHALAGFAIFACGVAARFLGI